MRNLSLFLIAAVFAFAMVACDDSGGDPAVENCTNTQDDDGDGLIDCDDPDCQAWSGCQTNNVDCGDGVKAAAEECDGTDFGSSSCTSRGYVAGELSCSVTCTIIETGCVNETTCGDDIAHSPIEDCDGDDLRAETCASLGYYGGTLSCSGDCGFNLASCETFGRCDDGIIQDLYGEECEGVNLNGANCESLGYYGGQLFCGGACLFDVTQCEGAGWCGDETLQSSEGEECDGSELGGETCESLGYGSGQLACSEQCGFDISGCQDSCGDGTIQSGEGEECDGSALGGETCELLGYYEGQLLCGEDCQFDVSGCEGFCGDGIIQSIAGETCDGTSLQGAYCLIGGTLSCDGGCQIEDANCNSFTQLSTEHHHTCGISSTGAAYCWGRNALGQIGDNT
ncbi:hypothetical protein KJ865_04345, partial [Myxococcota bacterium]|nr:hypothetical protein [Myxococcota bacterium]